MTEALGDYDDGDMVGDHQSCHRVAEFVGVDVGQTGSL